MYVKQEYRRQSIGKLLLNELIEKAKAINEVEVLLLKIVKNNFSAKQLYLLLGFQIYGIEEMAYKSNQKYFDLKLMRLQIK